MSDDTNKVAAEITFTIKYMINPDHYPADMTVEQMLLVDLEHAENDPCTFMEMEELQISGRIVE